MEARELRIGNYVTGAKGAKYNGDTVKWNIGDYIECNKYCDYIDSFRPIPITEEWLIKFGFEKDIDGSYMFGIISIFKDRRLKENVYIFTEDKIYEGEWVVINDLKLKYVHQLQNLYFALTGEELTLINQ